MVIVNQISNSAKKSELKKVDFWARSITFCEKTRREKTSYLQTSRNSFDNFYKSWCHRCKNNRFWVLIFLLSRKINILWTPKKDFEAPKKKWAHNNSWMLCENFLQLASHNLTNFAKIEAVATKINFFELWFFFWIKNLLF